MMIKVISYIFVVLFVVGVSADGLNNGEACQLCIDIVSAIEDFLTNGATQDDIIAWAEQYCESLGPASQKICERLIEEKLPDIIDSLVNGLPPQEVCEFIIGDCSSSSTPTPEDKWFYLMTLLEGERVLKMMPGSRDVEMYGKDEYNSDGQLWRIENNGCLRNMGHKTRCLAIEGDSQGARVAMLEETGGDEQNWKFTDDNYIQSKLRGDGVILHRHLVLDVEWADVPLVTDGARLRAWHEDDSASEKWKMIPWN